MAAIKMAYSVKLCNMKVSMCNTRLTYSWLQLVQKRQFGFFDHFHCKCFKCNRTSKSNVYIFKTRQFCLIDTIIKPKIFGERMFFREFLIPFRNFYLGRWPLQAGCEHSHRQCWNCGRDTSPVRELFFCDCGVVQKPANELTFFDLMQIKPSFDIDTKILGNVFKETQKRLHPDKFSAKTQEERDLAQQQSALLNKAYNTLLKPLSRAIYLLGQHNIEISEKDSFTEPEFLQEIMESNEQISSAKKASDVEALEIKNDAKIAECVKEISNLYSKNLMNEMKNITIKLRYYTTIQERINELKRSSMG